MNLKRMSFTARGGRWLFEIVPNRANSQGGSVNLRGQQRCPLITGGQSTTNRRAEWNADCWHAVACPALQ